MCAWCFGLHREGNLARSRHDGIGGGASDSDRTVVLVSVPFNANVARFSPCRGPAILDLPEIYAEPGAGGGRWRGRGRGRR